MSDTPPASVVTGPRSAGRRGGQLPAVRSVAGLAGGRVLAAALSWAWLVVAARSLSLPEFGDLALLLAVGAMVSVMTDLGLPLVLMDVVSTTRGAAWPALVLTVRKRLVAAAGAIAVAVVAYCLVAHDRSPLVPLAFGLSIASTAVYTSVTATLRSLGRVRAEAANETLSRLLVLTLGWLWLAHGGGLLAAVFTYAVADLASAVVLWALALRVPRGGQADVDRTAFAVRRTAPLAVAGILAVVYYRVDVWLLALLRDADSVARYAAAYRLLDGLLLPAGALSALVIPLTSRLTRGERLRSLDRMARLTVLVVAPLAGLAALLAGPILEAAFGPAYRSAAGVLALLMAAVPPSVAILVWAPAAALDDRARFARVVAGVLILNVVGNVALIPRYGPVGAAWATAVSQVVLAWQLRRGLDRHGEVADA